MSSTVQTLRDTVADTLASLRGPVLIVHPSVEIVGAVVDSLREEGAANDRVQILASRSVLKSVRDDFTVATAAAALIEEDRLALRAAESPSGQFLVVTEQRIHTLVRADDAAVSVTADDVEFVGEAYETYAGEWERAEAFDLRTPGLSRLLETLEAEMGEETRTDFETMLRSLSGVDADEEYNEVELSILAAARNRVLLYDLSRWGEDVGLASKATFSRTKSRLEEQGYVTTEKVPIDVGRPRLRLTLTEKGRRSLEREGTPAPSVTRSDA